MHRFVLFNREIITAGKANLQAVSSAAFYGKSIFTTIAIYNKEAFLWEKHWQRLADNAARIGLTFEFTKKDIFISLQELITKNKIISGRARLTFFDESATGIWAIKNNKETSFLITTADLRSVPEELKLTVSPYRLNSASPLVNTKSGNYLENILALEEAKKRGFDEAVRLNEKGEIVSASLANIFWLKGDEIFTPGLKTGCLAGTTRELILEKYKVFEVEENIESLQNAEAVFLTSAGLGMRQTFFNEKHIKVLRFVDLLPFAK